MVPSRISKAAFKAHALEVLRQVEATGQSVLITDRGRPVVRIDPYYGDDDADVLASLRGTVRAYRDPTAPVPDAGWEALGE
jgi:prevent-host-death family protein